MTKLLIPTVKFDLIRFIDDNDDLEDYAVVQLLIQDDLF